VYVATDVLAFFFDETRKPELGLFLLGHTIQYIMLLGWGTRAPVRETGDGFAKSIGVAGVRLAKRLRPNAGAGFARWW
jgi:hypothetical protein